MENKSDLDQVLDELENYVKELNDEYLDRNIEQTGIIKDEQVPKGLRCRRSAHHYIVIGLDEETYLNIVVAKDLQATIAEGIGNYYKNSETPTEVDFEQEAVEYLESINNDEMDRFRYYLAEKIASEQLGSSLMHTSGGAVKGFHIQLKIFPYSEDFDLESFERSIQAAVSVAWRGENFIRESFNLDSLEEGKDVKLEYPTG